MSVDDMIAYLARETALIRDIPRPQHDETCRRAESAFRKLTDLLQNADTTASQS